MSPPLPSPENFNHTLSQSSVARDVTSPESVDGLKKFKRRLEAEKILYNLYGIDL